MNGLATWLGGRIGKGVGTIFGLLAIAMAVYAIKQTFVNSAAATAADRVFIDAENGKAFNKTIEAGMSIPVISPFSGKATGYEAEFCYWTKEGTLKTDPTPVLLNSYEGIKGPTFCPDCGRLVVAHNSVGPKPPPTEQEYLSRIANH